MADEVEPLYIHGWIIVLVFLLQPLHDWRGAGCTDRRRGDDGYRVLYGCIGVPHPYVRCFWSVRPPDIQHEYHPPELVTIQCKPSLPPSLTRSKNSIHPLETLSCPLVPTVDKSTVVCQSRLPETTPCRKMHSRPHYLIFHSRMNLPSSIIYL